MSQIQGETQGMLSTRKEDTRTWSHLENFREFQEIFTTKKIVKIEKRSPIINTYKILMSIDIVAMLIKGKEISNFICK